MKCAGSKGPVPLSPEIAERLPDLGVELAVELVAAVGRVVDDPPVGDLLVEDAAATSPAEPGEKPRSRA